MLYLYFIVYVCLPVNVESASPIFITLYPFSLDILKFLSTLIFVIFVWATNDSLWSFLPYFVFAPVAGFIAFKSKSIVYSGVSQLIVMILFHIIVIKTIGG